MDIKLLSVEQKPFDKYEKYLPFAQKDRIEKIRNLKSDRDKNIALLSHLFARHKIAEELNTPFDKVKILYNSHGKPYIERDNFHFSISHSDNLIAFVHHSSPVGIDIQKTESTVSPAIRFFTPNERSYISNDPSRFFEIWTKKEAYIKMLGTGLSTPLSSFDVLSEGINSMLFSTCFEGFFISVCGENLTKIDTQIKYV